MQSPQLPFLLMAIGAAVLMGTIGPLSRMVEVSPEVVTFYRVFIGALFLVLYLVLSGALRRSRVLIRKRQLASGAALAGFMVLYIKALQLMPMAQAVMILYFAPILASVIAHFVLAEPLTKASLSLVMLGFTGFVFLIDLSALTASEGSEYGSGLLFASLSCLTYCAFILLNRTSSEGSSPSLNTLIQLVVASTLLLPFAWNWGLPSTDQLPWLVAIGFFTGFLAMLLAISALAHLPATTYGTLAYLEPFTVALLAWCLFGESLSLSDALGAGLIVIAGLGQSRLSLRGPE